MTAAPLKTFIIYAREDKDALLELKKQLIPLERSRQIALWYDGEIVPGEEWEKAIKNQLEQADIILLLLSSDFFASDYIEKEELRAALARHERAEAVVAPVIVRHCLWQAHPEIEKLQVLPDNAFPVYSKRNWDSPDEAFANVAAGIARMVKSKAEAERQAKEKEEQKPREKAAQAFIEMIPVEGGPFQLGGKHAVTVPNFEIGKYPVTQQQWQEIMGNNPSKFKGDDLPVESVSWDDAKAFIQKLNERFPGRHFRLPSEAEWEYAARGGRLSKGYEYAGSNQLDEVGWFWENSGDKPLSGVWDWKKIEKNNCRTHPVGLKKANELGIHDMSGNVWEWCEDDWHDSYQGAPDDGSAWIDQPKRGDSRVLRGGSWFNGAGGCRVSDRFSGAPGSRSLILGFRLVSSSRR